MDACTTSSACPADPDPICPVKSSGALDKISEANRLLKCYYEASGSESENLLGDLATCLRTIVRGFFARKGVRGEDLQDLCSDTVCHLIVALRKSRLPDGRPFDECVRYARTVARNLYIDRLRRDDPWRAFQLSVLKFLPEEAQNGLLARWRSGSVTLCGLAQWHGRSFRPTTRYTEFREDDSLFREQALDRRDPGGTPLPELMAHLFAWIDTPLELEDLVACLVALRPLGGLSIVSADALEDQHHLTLASSETSPEKQAVESRALEEMGARIWQEVCLLRPLQRATLLLAMEWDDWLRLGWMPLAVADTLEISHSDMMEIWSTLPLTDRSIAERLGVKEEQVPNLRKCARERLRRRCPI